MNQPIVVPVEGKVVVGTTIQVYGSINLDALVFALNLQCGPNIYPRDDVALHLSADFMRGVLKLSSIHNRNWGPDEYGGSFPFIKGTHFEIEFVCHEDSFNIVINDSSYFSFIHRIPFSKITHIAIDGHITLGGIKFNGSTSSYGFNVSHSTPYSIGPYQQPPMSSPYSTNQSYQPPPYPSAQTAPPYPSAQTAPPYPTGQNVSPYPTGQNAPLYPAGQRVPPYPSGQTAPYYSANPSASQLGYPMGNQPYLAPVTGGQSYPVQPGLHTSYQQPDYNRPPPGSYNGQKSKGILDKAGMALAGAVGGGLVGSVLTGKKALKGNKKKKALKYGLPLAGVGLGAYALQKGFRRSSSSSSSSSYSD